MVGRAVAVVVLLMTTVGCASAEPAAREEGPRAWQSSGTSETPDATGSPSEEPLPCVPGAEPFTGPAADEFGPERVMAAYCMLADLTREQGRTSLALPIPEQRPKDVEALGSILSPPARQQWGQQVRARAAGAEEATRRINGLTLHDVSLVPRGYVRADDLPHVFGTKVGPAVADVVRDGAALSLAFTMETGLVLEARGDTSGRHSLLPVTRKATYVLVPDGDGWLVDDWTAEFSHDRVQLVTRG